MLPKQIIENLDKYNIRNDHYNLRNGNMFPILRFRSNWGKKNSYNNTVIWNTLTDDIKKINSETLFLKK